MSAATTVFTLQFIKSASKNCFRINVIKFNYYNRFRVIRIRGAGSNTKSMFTVVNIITKYSYLAVMTFAALIVEFQTILI